MKKLVYIVILLAASIGILSACSGSSVSFTEAQGVIPDYLSRVQAEFLQEMRVNIYVQGTSDMLPLFDSDSVYTDVLGVLQNAAVDLWGSQVVSQYMFRFDVEWQEDRPRTAYNFAYPLDPDWWNRPSGVFPQIPQIFDPNFYSLEWYLDQNLRDPSEYERHIVDENPPFNDRQQARISRTLDEIRTLRIDENEISVMVTNFIGHSSAGVPTEDESITSRVLEYLQIRPDSAIGVFAFENSGNVFYILVMGTANHTAAFSDRLLNMLPLVPETLENEDEENITLYNPINHTFNFYTSAQVATSLSSNLPLSYGEFSTDIISINPHDGLVNAFGSDWSDGEENLFQSHFGNTNMVLRAASRQLRNSYASVDVSLRVNIPYIVLEHTLLRPEFYFDILTADGLESTSVAGTNVSDMEVVPLGDGYSKITMTVNLDTSAFPSRDTRARLIVRLYENTGFNPPQSFGNYNSSLFTNTFNQLGTDIQLAAHRRLQDNLSHLAAEIYLYFIYV